MTYNKTKKLLALLLALTMCFSLLPVSAFADGEPEEGACRHEPGEAVTENEVKPSCTEAGSHDVVVYCTACGEELSRESVIDPAAHTPGEAVTENAVAATCTEPGSHDVVVYCAVCGEELSRESVIDPAAHTPGEAVTENEVKPSCTEAGSHDVVVYCTACGEELEREGVIDPAAHTPKDVEELPPEVGVPGHKAGVVCAVCGETLEGCEELEALPEENGWSVRAAAVTAMGLNTLSADGNVVSYGSCGKDGDNVIWALDDAGVLTISGTGSMADYDSYPPWYENYREIIISVVIEFGVMSIGNTAFDGCTGLTSVTLPRSITTIGEDAFSNCTNLPDGVVYYAGDENEWACLNISDGNDALTNVTKKVYGQSSDSSIVTARGSCGTGVNWALLSNGALLIFGTGAMANYSGTGASKAPWYKRTDISSVVIESGVMSIGNTAFYGCTGLTSVTLPTGLTSIGNNAFDGCTGLTSVTLPTGVTSIGSGAFDGCTGLREITIPKSVTSIGEHAFDECACLQTVNFGGTRAQWDELYSDLPDTVEVICDLLAEGVCGDPNVNSGKNVTWELSSDGVLTISGTGEMKNDYPSWSSYRENIISVVIESGVTSVGENAFYECSSLTGVTLPATVTSIGHAAFIFCEKLADVTLAAGLTAIDIAAFQHCKKLESITLPDSLTSIGGGAFEYCTGLTDVTIPKGVTSIGDCAFYDCESLTAFTVAGGNTSFCAENGVLFSADGKTLVQYPTGRVGASYTVPADVTAIADGAFACCTQLAGVTLPAGLTAIADLTFNGCEGLTGITIPAGVTSIGNMAFACCTGLTELTVPADVTTIGEYAFDGCEGLTDVTFPAGLTSIGDYAFDGCTKLADVYHMGTRTQVQITIGDNNVPLQSATHHYLSDSGSCGAEGGNVAWVLYDDGLLVISGTGAMADYDDSQNAAPWDKAGILSVVIKEGVTSIGDYAFCECTGLTDLTLPLSLTGIGENAFSGCTGLTDVYYGGSRAQLYAMAAAGNEALKNATGHFGRFTVDCGALGGTITADKTDAAEGDVITLTFDPDAGRTLLENSLCVSWTDDSGVTRDAALTQGTGEDANTWTFNMPAYDVRVTALFEDSVFPTTLTLDAAYLALQAGGPVRQLTLVGLPPEFAPLVRWSSDNEAAVTVGKTGKLTAVAKGVAWITASLNTDEGVLTARCRVDVAPEPLAAQVTGVRLIDTKATAELYKTDYTRIQVVPELEQNLQAQALGTGTRAASPKGGAAVQSARFVDETADKHFELRVVDDRTLEIVPREEWITVDKAMLKQLKSTYKSAIAVTVDDVEFITGPLTLTLKRSLPRNVSVKAVKLNSFLVGDTQALIITGTPSATVRATSMPDWLSFDAATSSVTYTGPHDVNKSGKLSLLVRPAGWVVSCAINVPVSVTKSMPKLTVKPAALNILPDVDELVMAEATITPAAYADPDVWPITVVSVTEGKNDAGTALAVIPEGHRIFVRTGADAPTDDKVHTYKVTLALEREGQASPARTTLTVKLLTSNTKISMSAKASGTIDTAIPKSPVTLKLTVSGMSTPSFMAEDTTVLQEKGKTQIGDVSDRFEIVQTGATSFVVTERVKGSLESGYTYTAVVRKSYGARTVECRVKLPVRFSDSAKVKPGAALKVKGAIDVIRPGSAVTVTPTLKNCFTYIPDAADLHIWRQDGKSWTDVSASSPFDVAVKDGAFVLTLRPDGDHTLYRYRVSLSATLDGTAVSTAMSAITVKMGAAKFTQSAKAVQLLKTDRNSRGMVTIRTADESLAAIDWDRTSAAFVSPTDKQKQPLLALTHLDGDECAIGFRDSTITTTKNATVKIPVYLVGNTGSKPNATISVSVKLA